MQPHAGSPWVEQLELARPAQIELSVTGQSQPVWWQCLENLAKGQEATLSWWTSRRTIWTIFTP
ncbi:MAG TPA: hypothetical protein DCM14_07180 [Clostridiales bacterium UBA8153]|nr:hypothetical protein [Clostridiales bacterium UBA8153]